jgi:hypothetical protein
MCAAEMGSSVTMYIPNFINITSAIDGRGGGTYRPTESIRKRIQILDKIAEENIWT